MARTAEVVTIKSLTDSLNSAKLEFDRGAHAAKVAKSVEKVPDAFEALNESAKLHNEVGLASVRKVVAKVVAKLGEASLTAVQAEKLIECAATLKLFEAGTVTPVAEKK